MTDIQINIKNKSYVTVNLNKTSIIENLKISLLANEFICLIGPSGCGKTTLLNIIAKLDPNFEGEILQGGEALHPNIGYVFQSPRLLPWRTVRENIELALDKKQSADSINSLVKSMQLEGFQQTYPEHLSLGMSRRVSIIRAFAIDPEILLMDEPFVSLDAPTARKVSELLIKLWQQRPHTILFVTHDLREAITLADRLIFLSASPMSVVSEVKVEIPRENRNDEKMIEAFRQKLLANHPEINDLL